MDGRLLQDHPEAGTFISARGDHVTDHAHNVLAVVFFTPDFLAHCLEAISQISSSSAFVGVNHELVAGMQKSVQ
jgi:hypothetical protein